MSVLSHQLLSDDLEADSDAGEEARRLVDSRIQATKRREFFALDLVLDVAYEGSPIILKDRLSDDHRAAGVGARLSHAWLGPGRSLYDELGPGYTILQLDDRAASEAAALERTLVEARVPVTILSVSDSRLRELQGGKIVLVRPDQHVAWAGDQLPADVRSLVRRVSGA